MSFTDDKLLTGLAPVLDEKVRILVLGSFPGAASLKAGQYYAHPRNQFWRLLGAVLGEELAALPYEQRLQRLLARQVGLWDVLAACQREGSLDTAIRRRQANDFTLLRQRCPRLARVGFNGQEAGRHAGLFAQAGFDTVILPSSSPAHAALGFEQKLASWRALAG
ncbi:MAG: mug [Paucimonas sp.]|nr:mug [Paucimonas sp.]